MIKRPTKPTAAVFQSLLDAAGHELHGFAIIKASGQHGPTVYKILERLAAAGLLTERWEVLADDERVGRPRRRYYRLTADGVAAARAYVERFKAW